MRIPFAITVIALLGATGGCIFDRDERVFFGLRGTVTDPDEAGLENVAVSLFQEFWPGELETNYFAVLRAEVVTDSTGKYDFGRLKLSDHDGQPLFEGFFRVDFTPEGPGYRGTSKDIGIAYDNTYDVDVTLERE